MSVPVVDAPRRKHQNPLPVCPFRLKTVRPVLVKHNINNYLTLLGMGSSEFLLAGSGTVPSFSLFSISACFRFADFFTILKTSRLNFQIRNM